MKKMKRNVALVSMIAAVVSAGIAVVQFARGSLSTPPTVIVYMVQDYPFPEKMSSIGSNRTASHPPRVVHAGPALRDPEAVAAD